MFIFTKIDLFYNLFFSITKIREIAGPPKTASCNSMFIMYSKTCLKWPPQIKSGLAQQVIARHGTSGIEHRFDLTVPPVLNTTCTNGPIVQLDHSSSKTWLLKAGYTASCQPKSVLTGWNDHEVGIGMEEFARDSWCLGGQLLVSSLRFTELLQHHLLIVISLHHWQLHRATISKQCPANENEMLWLGG